MRKIVKEIKKSTIFATYLSAKNEISESHIVKPSNTAHSMRHIAHLMVFVAIIKQSTGLSHYRLWTLANPAPILSSSPAFTTLGSFVCRRRNIHDGRIEKQKPSFASKFIYAEQHPCPTTRPVRPTPPTATKQPHYASHTLCIFSPLRILPDSASIHSILHISATVPRLTFLPKTSTHSSHILDSPNLSKILLFSFLHCIPHSHHATILVLWWNSHHHQHASAVRFTSSIHNFHSRLPCLTSTHPCSFISPHLFVFHLSHPYFNHHYAHRRHYRFSDKQTV